jgi:cation diffusion facilitator CzcD-associated flavoprotein CzcO
MRQWRKKEAIEHLNAQISDPALRKKLTPDYTIGCKRILISDEYYPTLTKEHVHLETDRIKAFSEKGILTQSGKEIEVDIIIYGTGFKTTTFSHIYKVIGLNNRNLFEEWNQQGGQAFKGINVSGFPNFLISVGPNTGLGHNSIIHMMESQYNYILDYLKKLQRHSSHTFFDVKIEKQNAYNKKLQEELEQMVWTTGGCQSYYLKDREGKNTSIWPGSTMKYRKLTKKMDLSDYNILHT